VFELLGLLGITVSTGKRLDYDTVYLNWVVPAPYPPYEAPL